MNNFFTNEWTLASNYPVGFSSKVHNTEGRIVYEYNPLHNYRLTKDEKDGDVVTIAAGTIVDMDTESLGFDLQHPVEITCQKSYDGTVNLILNDNKNIPRLINTRFTVRLNNTYEVVDRIGNNDTNIYDSGQFDLDTSLYKRIVEIPEIKYNGIHIGGNLKVGNYVIYIKYADADDNETDIVAESGIISCFIGEDGNPRSIKGGYRDENSNKQIMLQVTNIDSNYDYLKVYYTRATSDVDQNRVTTAYKIMARFPIKNSKCDVLITGNEQVQEIPLSELNIKYFIADQIKTQAECSNRLFIGNVRKEECDYTNLQDLSLRIYPTIVQNEASTFIGEVDCHYSDISTSKNKDEYYNSYNIYHRVGYWNLELYRFGIVYILNSGLLSPVFNILGVKNLGTDPPTGEAELHKVYENDVRKYLDIDESTYSVAKNETLNSKGVCRIKVTADDAYEVLGIRMNIPKEVIDFLNGKVKGFFFVRQKRIPIKLCQAYLMPHDNFSGLPKINYNSQCIYESFIEQSSRRSLLHDYTKRLNSSGTVSIDSFVGICPESELNQSLYNQLFTGASTLVKLATNSASTSKGSLDRDIYQSRHYYNKMPEHATNSSVYTEANVANVPDSAPLIVVDDYRFRASAGEATQANKFQYMDNKNKSTSALNIVRGNWGPYVGIIGKNLSYGLIVDIYAQGFKESGISEQFKIRYEDSSEYMAIGDRIQINRLKPTGKLYTIDQYRGDCYICNFTHRLNRNFQDPSAPINDTIIEASSWKDNYDAEDAAKSGKINRGDVNAVRLGSWITIKVYASRNISLRTEDLSYPTEQGMNGHPRGFYPYQSISSEGNYKSPESFVLNDGYGASLGERWNHTLPQVPYYKNVYLTRVYYSDISITDAFKNGYRVFREPDYRDYPTKYGGLMKLIPCKSNLVAIFEHGICLLPVNERTQTAESVGGDIFINTNKVLPENPSSIITDEYGTLWPDSVIKTPKAIYGVDTVAKKIWQISLTDLTINCISDFKVQQFLNLHIKLGEFQFSPIIGVRNVKTHYNRFKQDVMFTFYNYTNSYLEEAWNLCFNEIKAKFQTFYSWIPSFSENIDNMYFTFNRDVSKWAAKLATSLSSNALADGITVANTIIGNGLYSSLLTLSNRNYNGWNLKFELLRDPWDNYKKFYIHEENDKSYLKQKENTVFELTTIMPVIYLCIKCTLTKDTANGGSYTSTIALTTNAAIENNSDFTEANFATHFWKHGLAGLIDIAEKIKPTVWYGVQHPFEFEFVVNENPSIHKIFNNLQIISNNAEPESFHYLIIGDAYDFAEDKLNMYYRQEATKCLLQHLGSDITYDNEYLESTHNLTPHKKSTILPFSYNRYDSMNTVYDNYKHIQEEYEDWKLYGGMNVDYVHLSGAEIAYDKVTDQYSVVEHSKAVSINSPGGRLRGNMTYKEDRFDIQINPLIFALKNEIVNQDKAYYPSIAIIGPLPNDVKKQNLTINNNKIDELKGSEIYDIYTSDHIDTKPWGNRKETKLRDKCIRIRIRYSGKNLAIITSVLTLYTLSYG